MISFTTDNVKMPPISRRLVREWVRLVAESYGRVENGIGYLFCDDDRILEVNRQFLGHDYYTDIITFDYSSGRKISGDLYISLDTVRSNSEKFGTDYSEELHRVIIHGVLHLCGINDKDPGERAKMESAENKALEILKKLVENENREN